MSARRYPGPVEAAARRDLRALITAHPFGEALSASSLLLARTLDAGAGLATAAVSKELRATLAELAALAVPGEDALDAELSGPQIPGEG